MQDNLGRIYVLKEGIEQNIVTKWHQNRSPGIVLVDLLNFVQAGALGNGLGPNFWPKIDPKPKIKSRF